MTQDKHGRFDRRGSPKRSQKVPKARTSWDPIADWYSGWMGKNGGIYHRKIAIPTLLKLLDIQPDQTVLDIGCGHGVPARSVADLGSSYVGVDASRKLIQRARHTHGAFGRFLTGDARKLDQLFPDQQFDAVFFLLSIQDMDPLASVLNSAEKVLKPGGRLAILMTHPCFRIPRQSGWGYDKQRKLSYRRIDSYLSAKAVPRTQKKRGAPVMRSFHRPLHAYVNGLAACGLVVDRLDEISSAQIALKSADSQHQNSEIPHFLGIRARKLLR